MSGPRSAESLLADIWEVVQAIHAIVELPVAAVPPTDFVFDHLLNGASADMNVNGSVAAVTFTYTVPAGVDLLWVRPNFHARDDSMEDPDGFFSRAVLGNGLLIAVRDPEGNLAEDFDTIANPVTSTAHFSSLAGVDVQSNTAANQSRYGIRWTIAAAGGAMRLPSGWTINLTVQDDLTQFTQFQAMVQGVLISD